MNVSYDEAFETRVSADIKVRFGGASTTAQRKEVQQLPVINALTSTPSNRDVRVHDDSTIPTYIDGNPVYPSKQSCIMSTLAPQCVPYEGGWTPTSPLYIGG